MPGQLLEFYGLREHPFGVSPNPRYLYASTQHREALESLISGIENFVGFAALIAEPGVGKTMLLFEALRRLNGRVSAALISNTQCSGLELLRFIMMGLKIPGAESEQDPIRLYHALTVFATERQHTQPVVIVIDEAQNLENSALETVRLLSNLEAADRKLLHIILAGQLELGEKLRSNKQLFQRITVICRLGRLSPKETEECIAFRLHTAGYNGPPLFSADAMARIKQASGGVPREIIRICINALDAGFALREKQIGIQVIEQVLADLDLNCCFPSDAPEVLGDTRLETTRRSLREPFEMPTHVSGFGRMPSDAWVVDPSVDIGLGDEVIESVLSGLDPSRSDPVSTPATNIQMADVETAPQVELEVLDQSERPRISYAQAGVGPSDDEITSLLSEIDASNKGRPEPTKQSGGGKPSMSHVEQKADAVEPKIPKPPVDERVLKIFAPRSPSVPVRSIVPTDFEAPAEEVVLPIREEAWVTGVPIDQWARGSFSEPPAEIPKRDENAADPGDSKRKRISPILIYMCLVLAALLLLYIAIPHLS